MSFFYSFWELANCVIKGSNVWFSFMGTRWWPEIVRKHHWRKGYHDNKAWESRYLQQAQDENHLQWYRDIFLGITIPTCQGASHFKTVDNVTISYFGYRDIRITKGTKNYTKNSLCSTEAPIRLVQMHFG